MTAIWDVRLMPTMWWVLIVALCCAELALALVAESRPRLMRWLLAVAPIVLLVGCVDTGSIPSSSQPARSVAPTTVPSTQPSVPLHASVVPSPSPSVVPSPSPGVAAACHAHDGLPDPSCTPGAVDPGVTLAMICKPGYSATVRPPTSYTEPIKIQEMRLYGLADQPLSTVELDHLISLELGGAPRDVANLWPEQWDGPTGAHAKDAVENAGHRAACDERMPLADVQHKIATDWIALGRELGVR